MIPSFFARPSILIFWLFGLHDDREDTVAHVLTKFTQYACVPLETEICKPSWLGQMARRRPDMQQELLNTALVLAQERCTDFGAIFLQIDEVSGQMHLPVGNHTEANDQ